MIQVVALAGTFANTGKYGITAVSFCDIVNQFHNQNRLADAGTAEQTDFAAFCIRFQQIDNLNAGGQNLSIGRLVHKCGSRTVNRIVKIRFNVTATVNRFADNVHNATQQRRSDRNLNRRIGINDFQTANQTFGLIHGNRTNNVFTQVLSHFQNQLAAVIVTLKRSQNRGQIISILKFNVDNRAHNLRNMSQLAAVFLFFLEFSDFFRTFAFIAFNLLNGLFLLSNVG